MIKIVCDVGNKAVFDRIRNQAGRVKKGIRRAYLDIAISHTRKLKKDLDDKGSKTGRFYVIKVRQRGRGKRPQPVLHQASARGQTPATVTGRYKRGVKTTRGTGYQFLFGVKNTPYAKYLEPEDKLFRPGLGNTIKAEQRNTRTYFEMRIDSSLKE